MAKYYSTKTYGHNIGLSAVFRQPNADHSHCHLLHGYSMQFKFTFGCDKLDNKNWAVDFGGLKPLKAWLEDSFDHKTCIDVDDPHKQDFYDIQDKDLCEVRKFEFHLVNLSTLFWKLLLTFKRNSLTYLFSTKLLISPNNVG